MRNVFIETSWVYGCCAPMPFRIPEAEALGDRAVLGEFRLLLPSHCLPAARVLILEHCGGGAISRPVRRYVRRAAEQGNVTAEEASAALALLDQYDQEVQSDLVSLDRYLERLSARHGIEVFPTNERMLERAGALLASQGELHLGQTQQETLAAILTRGELLRESGAKDTLLCTLDPELLPWDKQLRRRDSLARLYASVNLEVVTDFFSI